MRAVYPVMAGLALLAAGAAPAEEAAPSEAELRASLDAALATLDIAPLAPLEDRHAPPEGEGQDFMPVIRAGTPDVTDIFKPSAPEPAVSETGSGVIGRPPGSYAIAEDPARYSNIRFAKPASVLTDRVASTLTDVPDEAVAVPGEDVPEMTAAAVVGPQGELRVKADAGMHNSLAALRQRTLSNPIAYPVPIAQAARSRHGPILKEGLNGARYVPTSEYAEIARMVARMHSVPEELFFKLVKAESNWNPEAVSRVGALGLAQLMPGTAKLLGVDPLDPYQNLEGGARYLAQQFDRFGSWDLALAAYNAGPGAVEQYGGIPPYPETQGYVRKILGIEVAQSGVQ